MIPSEIATAIGLKLKCAQPVVTRGPADNQFSISVGSFPTSGGVLYYTIGTGTPDTQYTGAVSSTFPVTVTAIARAEDYDDSDLTVKTIGTGLDGTGTLNDPYLIASTADFKIFVAHVNANANDDASKHYKLVGNVSASGTSEITTTFTGSLEGSADADGNFYTISDLDHPLFSTIDGSTNSAEVTYVSNIILKDVNISGHAGNTGAIACLLKGNSIIYNCGILSGSVDGTGDTGGLVGLMQHTVYDVSDPINSFTRVVNCFSFADVSSSGEYAAGIVGKNSYGSNINGYGNQGDCKLKNVIINCMFYGNITSGTNKRPVYGGTKINNTGNGINNYDYFLDSVSFASELTLLEHYNGALPAAVEDLNNVEFYRSILNCNRNLCAFYISGKPYSDPANEIARGKMAKWVLDPSIAPFPILKQWKKYPSVINFDPDDVLDENDQWTDRHSVEAWRGKLMGSLSVTVNPGSHNSSAASKAIALNIIDMDTLHHDFGFCKVQLPYYNEVFGNPDAETFELKYGNNYTDSIVTGWKITEVTDDGSVASYDIRSFSDDLDGGYNFADRYCYDKDLYAVSDRVFAQGGYYYVPQGVVAITIEAYWGKAVYLANRDRYVDRVNNGTFNYTPAGQVPDNFRGHKVFNYIKDAINDPTDGLSSYEANYDLDNYHKPRITVYDQAVVLVSNYQNYMNNANDDIWGPKNSVNNVQAYNALHPFTITSVDLDFDNEPDFCLQMQFSYSSSRAEIHPIRFDFLPVPTLGMAIRTDSKPLSIGHFLPRGHFEITETAFIEMREFEYDARKKYGNSFKEEAPVILNGGRLDKILTSENDCPDEVMVNGIKYPIATRTRYMIIGGRLRMETYSQSTHPKRGYLTRHCPVSVMGGEFDQFYLSGLYVPYGVTTAYYDNPYCYINGGKFGEMAGSGLDMIRGSVTFSIDHARINNFYGGGINAAMPINGSVMVYINNSIVDQYCGGPKFGDMPGNMTGNTYSSVTTTAEGTRFGVYYGAGYGGTSFTNELLFDNGANNFGNAIPTPDQWREKFNGYTPIHYLSGNNTYQVQYKYEFWNLPAGTASNQVLARLYSLNAQFTTSRSGDANSSLTNCEVLGDCYGGGRFGAVSGSTMLSLTTTTVHGSVYGGGFSYARPSFEVYVKPTADEDFPKRNDVGVCVPGKILSDGITYYWTNNHPDGVNENNPVFQSGDSTYFYTNVNMSTLGEVEGDTYVFLDGSTIYGDVFGGGNRSDVHGNTNVEDFEIVGNNTIVKGNVYGGGNIASTFCNTAVALSKTTVGAEGDVTVGSVFGGGCGSSTNLTAGRVGGNSTVTIRDDSKVYGNVYGGGRMASTGIDAMGDMQSDSEEITYGHTTVNISDAEIGYDFGYGLENFEPTRYIDSIGCVFGGGRGVADADKLEFAKVKTTNVNIAGDANLWGNVYGGGEMGKVKDSTSVTIGGNASVRLRAFAAGRGYLVDDNPAFKHCGDVGEETIGDEPHHGLARITLKDNAKVLVCLYGGAKIASVHGNAYVKLEGGQVGRKRTMEQIKSQPSHCYVFGSSQGTNKHGEFNTWSNVDTAYVTVRPGVRVFGSVFGGGEDGHVLGDIHLDIEMGANDSIGTFGYSEIDGNVFGGGRGYEPQSYTVGGVGGNIYTHIYSSNDIPDNMRPLILGSVFGGGRYASSGIRFTAGDDAGTPIEDDPENNLYYGHTKVLIEGKIGIGHDPVGENLIGWFGGNVYGGAMGDDTDANDPDNIGARMGFVKQTDVTIGGNALVKGTVNGGGECGSVLKDTKVTISDNCIIGVDRLGDIPTDELIYSGSVVGGGWGSDEFDYVDVGRVYGNTKIIVEGGHIYNNIYGGGEHASIGTIENGTPKANTGHATIIMKGGQLGPLDMTGLNAYVFGGGQGLGNDPDNLKKDFGQVFSTEVIVKDSIDGESTVSSPVIYGSVFGGGQDGHVVDTAYVEFDGGTIGTEGTTSWDGNIFGGGRNYMGLHAATGRVGATVRINVTGGLMKGCIYGGGRLGSVGVDDEGVMLEDETGTDGKKHGHITINITGGTIGNENNWETDHTTSGNVYGGGMGRLTKLDDSTNPIWPSLARVKKTAINVSQVSDSKPTVINNSVYGGGELGTVDDDAAISVESGSIMRDVYGGGYGSKDVVRKGDIGTSSQSVWVTPMQMAGRVGGNTNISIGGGWVRKSVYGGGEFATVGYIQNDSIRHVIQEDAVPGNPNVVVHHFPYSWPYEFNFAENTGVATIEITGGRIGITGSDYMGPTNEEGQPINPETGELLTDDQIDDLEIDNGDIYGGGKGFADNRYLEAHCANLFASNITIDYTNESATPTNYKKDLTKPCITGALYGGGENGHVYTDARIDFKKGLVGHNIYGGGKGKDKYMAHLLKPDGTPVDREVSSLTAGKVYGNTHVDISGGYVVRNVYGGGNLASVGKGNYAGGYGDYSTLGYGEVASNMEQWADTTNCGHTFITITGGQLGYLNPGNPDKVVKDSIPYGSVFGGCRGMAVPNAPDPTLSPRIKYFPEHFLGYSNHTYVNIGIKDSETGLRIYGSVYGGGQDGHVRWNTKVNINSGKVGVKFGSDVVSDDASVNSDPESFHWFSRGNVYGAGSGVCLNEEKEYCNIAGSVTHKTFVNINGGEVYRNVYGGGNLSTVGPPRIRQDHDCDMDVSCTTVNINAPLGQNAAEGYGGNVFGASCGSWDGIHDFSKFAFCPYTVVNINEDAIVPGSVYGGGKLGPVGVSSDNVESKHNTYVNIYGEVKGNVYGGGKGIVVDPDSPKTDTIAKVFGSTVVVMDGEKAKVGGSIFGGGEDGMVWCNTDVTIKNGIVGVNEVINPDPEVGNVFGGGRGMGQYGDGQYSAIAGKVEGNTLVTITGGHINGNVFGGGELASVGKQLEGGDADPNTGWARVKISGDGTVIGTDANVDNEHGNVFGASRGVAGEEYQNFAYVNNTLVTLANPGAPVVKGSIYGSGDDGHVLLNTQVTINNANGKVGLEGFANTEKGNVYGGGRGVNLDANGNLSPSAGLVKGHTKVNIFHGQVFGDVFGGGNKSAVVHDKLVNVYGSGVVYGSVYGGSKAVPRSVSNNTGFKTVNVRETCEIKGNVYGCSYDVVDGNPTAPATDRTAFINIDGGKIGGNVYGAGWTGEVKGSVSINIGANAIKYTNNGVVMPRDIANIRFNDSGGLPIVVLSGVSDINTVSRKATFNSFLVDEGAPSNQREMGICWSNSLGTLPTPDGPHAQATDYTVGNYSLTVEGLTGDTYYVRSYAKNGDYGIAYSPLMMLTMQTNGTLALVPDTQQPVNAVPTYNPVAHKLTIDGSVYGGSNHIGSDPNSSNWEAFDITGHSYIIIDGSDYNTQSNDPDVSVYMNIGGGLYGCGTHCESGKQGRHIFLKDYGKRTPEGDAEMTSATRTLTTIQRCDNVLLANSNVNLSGDVDISGHDHRNYAVLLVDKGLYMAEASALNLGATNQPAYMDSIRMVRSVLLKGNSADYTNPVTFWGTTINSDIWDWVGIKGDSPENAKLYRIVGATPSTDPLNFSQENVLLFQGDSRLWVRYHEKKEGDTQVKQYYGELNGFFRMKSPFLPYGTKSFAYARPKLTLLNKDANSAADERNKGDGGFLSYETVKNFHTQTIDNPNYTPGDDGGDKYTQTKQYPYTNVMELSSKGEIVDMTQYREWVIRKPLGKNWYVDGTRGWGKDLMRPVGDEIGNDDFSWKYNWGRYPDKPKQTISGPEGVFAGTYSGVDDKVDFHYKDNIVYYTQQDQQQGLIPEGYSVGDINPNETYYQDAVYVVGPLDGIKECVDNNSYTNSNGHTLLYSFVNLEPDYNLILLRYPGGHEMSNTKTDKTNASFNIMPTQGSDWTGAATNSEAGPGANYDALMNVQAKGIVLDNVYMDGLYGNNGFDFAANVINPSYFHPENMMRPLVVTTTNSNLTMKGGTTLTGGCNNIDGAVWYDNSDYNGNGLHGGAVYVDAGATVNVEGRVSIAGNLQKKGSALVESNVYLPTFAKHVNITNDLTGSSIGITSPIRNAQSHYTFNTFSPIAVGVREGYETTDAANAWTNNNFYDDLDWFFYKGGPNAENRTTYYSTSIADYPGRILESETAQYIFPDKTLFFGWTWANVVREAPNRMILNTNNEPVEASFSHEDINSPEALAWIISEVNGLNGQQANDLTGTTVTQTANIDLQQYVWVPIGANLTEAMPFSGKYEGRGHLITNLDIDYIGYSDGRYGYTDYGLFGYVKSDGDNEGVINRTFVVSGLIRPEGTANIGGLVGRMEGANALISNSEAAIEIHCPNLASPSTSQVGSGGLVGKMIGGTIHSSMAMPDVTIDQYYAAGGLVGYADEDAVVENSFANAKFEIGNNGSNTTHGAGGLVGDGKRLSLKNCYSHLYDNATNLPKFKLFVANRGAAEITNCYGFESNYEYCNSGNDNLTSCAKYTSTTDADTYKYMYSDNVVTINGKESPLFQKLNEWVGNSTTYAHWARPTLAEINHDLPVLMLCNYENGDKNKEGLGEFRSLGTYNKGVPLQYGGTVRDGSGKQLSTMLGRDEYVFVYGDVTEDLSSATVEADKVAIYEHAAILNPGKLGEYPNNYVGVTFDNTSRKATDFYGNPLPHDWHLFSTPLSNAPLGIDYNGLNTSTSTQYNHWASPPQVLPVFNFYDATENDGINDGYFPSKVPTGYQNPYANHALNGELDRYKYPFDFFCWYEPDWQWINFKRNGPSHYHYDVDTIYSYHIHDHINYKAYFGENSEDDAPVNVNENTLVKGKGYQMAIHDDTYLQSHGSLNSGKVSITVVNSKESGTLWGVGSLYTGNNLIGNPYHAYLDFDLTGWQGYYLYDADTAGIRNVDYLIYVRGGSKGGCYAPRYLHPHQGFYIQTNTRETLDFLPSMTVTRSVASNTAFRDEKPAYPLVNLFAYDEEGRGDVLVVEFHRPENGGGKKAKALRNGNHLVFAHHDGSDYGAFFAKEGTKQVPVRFQSFEAESKPYTFRWNLQNGDFQSLYLIDNLTGVTYDMLSNDSYSFVASKQDYLSRFLIVFDVTEVEEHEDESLNFAFHDGSSWVVNGKGRLELIDVTGRILYAENLHGDQNRVSLNNYAKGVYLLRLWEGDRPKIQKIIMH